MARNDLDARVPGGIDQTAVRRFPAIDHGGDGETGAMPVESRAVGMVVGGAQQELVADGHGVAIQVARDRRCQENAGPVVVGEHQGTLDGTRGQHDLPGAYPVQALTGAVRGNQAEMVRAAL